MNKVIFLAIFLIAWSCGKDELNGPSSQSMIVQRTGTGGAGAANVAADCSCRSGGVPICGRDNKNYSNYCHALCEGQQIMNIGRCPSPREPGCFCDGVKAEVCGDNGKTYYNACDAGCADVPVVSQGPCGGEVSQLNICDCPFTVDPVCGNDGRTYENTCVAQCFKVSWTKGMCTKDSPTDGGGLER